MWPFGSKHTARRKEIRRSRAEREGVWYRRLPGDWLLPTGGIVLVAGLVAMFIVNAGGPALPFRAGQVVDRPLASRVNFEVEDEQRTIEMRVQARDASPNYYRLDTALIDDIVGRLASALTLAKANRDDPQRIREAAAANRVLLDDASIAELLRLADGEDGRAYDGLVDAAAAALRARPLVEPEGVGVRRTAQSAVLADPATGQQRTLPMGQLQFATSSNAPAVQRIAEDVANSFPEPLRRSIQLSIVAMLTTESGDVRPLYRYETERTLEMAEKAALAVPEQSFRYSAGDVLADAGVITDDELRLLRAEQNAFREQQDAGLIGGTMTALGRAALVWMVVLGVFFCVICVQSRAFMRVLRRTIVLSVLLAAMALTRWAFVSWGAPPELAVGFVAFCAGLLGIVYHHNVVFAVSAGFITLMTLTVEQGVGLLVTLALVSAILIFGLRDVRNRGKIVLVGTAAAAAAFSSTAVAGFAGGQEVNFVLKQCLWAAGSTLLAAFIIEGILPGIERVFRLSTGMTLLEWCDANKPLMRLMAAEAPGTYNHSLLVGALAEAAAEAIGADGLLARTGAYYHDIGKINKPEYFVENQLAGTSRHERLSPAMSLLIIIGHVKDGVEMAREYGLPVALHPFISEHHGTTLVEYFYHAASRARRPDDPVIPESEFRYPGPKPQSREAAVVMLCDGVEGAVRAMQEPTPGRIEDVVGEIVRKRLMDGQFDECDITFRELAEVQKSLIKSLCSIYHGRIKYPTEEELADSSTAVRSAS